MIFVSCFSVKLIIFEQKIIQDQFLLINILSTVAKTKMVEDFLLQFSPLYLHKSEKTFGKNFRDTLYIEKNE